MSRASAAPASPSMSPISTLAPPAAKRRDRPSPSPDAPPVTSGDLALDSMLTELAVSLGSRHRGIATQFVHRVGLFDLRQWPASRWSPWRPKFWPATRPPSRWPRSVACAFHHRVGARRWVRRPAARRQRRRVKTRSPDLAAANASHVPARCCELVSPLHVRLVVCVCLVEEQRLDDAPHTGQRRRRSRTSRAVAARRAR